MTTLPPAPKQDLDRGWQMALITVGLVIGALFLIEVVTGIWSPLDLFR